MIFGVLRMSNSPVPHDVSGLSDLERRIASRIARQRADFERQARLISDVRLDAARMRAHAGAGRMDASFASSSSSSSSGHA